MRIILTGGGTGGHIYPALAVAERLQALHPDCEILYVGTDRGLEKDIVPKRNLPFRTIHAEGLPRKLTPALLKAVKKSADGCLEARKIVKSFQSITLYQKTATYVAVFVFYIIFLWLRVG